MADYTMTAREGVDLVERPQWQTQRARTATANMALLDTAKVAGGDARYRYDKSPYDHKLVVERLGRRVRVESLGLTPEDAR